MQVKVTSKQKERLAEVLCESVRLYGFEGKPSVYQNKVALGSMTLDSRKMSVVETLHEKGLVTAYGRKGELLDSAAYCEFVALTDEGLELAKLAVPVFYNETCDSLLVRAEEHRKQAS